MNSYLISKGLSLKRIINLKTMTRDLDEGEIRKLGEKQVSVLIDKMKVKRDAFTDELIAKRLAQKTRFY